MSTATALSRSSQPDQPPRTSHARTFVARLSLGMAAACWLAGLAAFLYGKWHAEHVVPGMVDASPMALAEFAHKVQRIWVIALAAGAALES